MQLAAVLLQFNCLTFISYDKRYHYKIATKPQITEYKIVTYAAEDPGSCLRQSPTCDGIKHVRFVRFISRYIDIYLYGISTSHIVSCQAIVHILLSNQIQECDH